MRYGYAQVQTRSVGQASEVSANVAKDIVLSLGNGPIVVITNNPQNFHAVIRKRWVYLKRMLEREHASTLSSWLRDRVELKLWFLESATFSVSNGLSDEADIYIVTRADIAPLVQCCSTFYLIEPIASYELQRIFGAGKRETRVVRYEVGVVVDGGRQAETSSFNGDPSRANH
jgi:hypothetical protein